MFLVRKPINIRDLYKERRTLHRVLFQVCVARRLFFVLFSHTLLSSTVLYWNAERGGEKWGEVGRKNKGNLPDPATQLLIAIVERETHPNAEKYCLVASIRAFHRHCPKTPQKYGERQGGINVENTTPFSSFTFSSFPCNFSLFNREAKHLTHKS